MFTLSEVSEIFSVRIVRVDFSSGFTRLLIFSLVRIREKMAGSLVNVSRERIGDFGSRS